MHDLAAAEGIEILGIDPAPSKETTLWTRGRCHRLKPGEVRPEIEKRLSEGQALLIGWDAPLSFDPAQEFYNRPIDKAVHRWINERKGEGRIEPKAVSALPFAGCPHWAITCHTLGFPYGTPPEGLELSPSTFTGPAPGHALVLETHPAVALALLWIEKGISDAFPRYKSGGAVTRANCQKIAEKLGFGPCQNADGTESWDDDALDAYVGWEMVRRFIRGEAILAGDPKKGGYLLPRCAESASIAARVEEESSPAKPLLGLLPQDEPDPSRGLGT
jgi:hypothetical protein